MQKEWEATPIIGSSARIIRGFSRIGIGVAVLTAVLGIAVTVSVAFNDYKSATQWPGTPVSKFDPDAFLAKSASDLPDAPWLQRDPVVKPPPFDPLKPYEAVAPKPANPFDRFDPPKPDPAIKAIGKPAFDQGEYKAYKRRAAAEEAKPKGPTLTPVDYDPFVGPAIRAAIVIIAIGLGITGAACLAVFGFLSGLGWVIAGFARD